VLRNTRFAARLVPVVAAIACGALALAACSSSSKPSSDGSSSASGGSGSSSSAATTNITIGVSAGLDAASMPLYYAADKGVFAKYGLNVKLDNLSSDTLALQGLQSNTYKYVFVGASSVATADQGGATAKIVDVPYPLLDYSFVTKTSIASLPGMKGKTLGVSSPGSQSAIIPVAMLANVGVSSSQLKIAQIGSGGDRAKALIAGTIDGAILDPFTTAGVESQKSIHVLAPTSQLAFMNSVIASSGKADPATTQKLVTAIIAASRTMWTDQSAFVSYANSRSDTLPSNSGQPVWDLLHKSTTPFYGLDGGMDQPAWDAMVKLLMSTKQLTASIAWSKVSDDTYTTAAVKTLGPSS
jgi:ABC-type nitrate/sulfonate/bicarbonate transport system substrate-binding protein